MTWSSGEKIVLLDIIVTDFIRQNRSDDLFLSSSLLVRSHYYYVLSQYNIYPNRMFDSQVCNVTYHLLTCRTLIS